MASRLGKQLDASQRFLRGLQNLPSFSETRARQLSQLLATVERVQSLREEETNSVLDLWQESLWGPESTASFKAQISARTNLIPPGVVGRRPLQNYLALPKYLTASLWVSLQGREPEEVRLQKLVRRAASLGLRCPTESTFAMLLTLTFAIHGALTEQKQRQVLLEFKARMKRWLSEPSPADYLEVLPEDVALLPASLMAAAFGEEARAECPLDEKHLWKVATQWPLRQRQSSSTSAHPASCAADPSMALMPLLSGIAVYAAQCGHAATQGVLSPGTPGFATASAQSSAGGAVSMGSGAPVPMLDLGTPGPTVEVVQPLAAGQASSSGTPGHGLKKSDQSPLLALEDGLSGDVERQEPSHVDRQTEELKNAVLPTGASPTRGQRSESSVQKKPAGKKTTNSRVLLKRPACVKKPAVQKCAQRSSQSLSREAQRQALLAKIPAALKKRYKDGCGKRRNRPLCTVSCWRLRGFE